jgi:hypothetical protein
MKLDSKEIKTLKELLSKLELDIENDIKDIRTIASDKNDVQDLLDIEDPKVSVSVEDPIEVKDHVEDPKVPIEVHVEVPVEIPVQAKIDPKKCNVGLCKKCPFLCTEDYDLLEDYDDNCFNIKKEFSYSEILEELLSGLVVVLIFLYLFKIVSGLFSLF